MVKKAPRRTAERIQTAALQLFNRFGEPNVATTLIASDMTPRRPRSTSAAT
jgi:AcrR family transcriptional regulator